jgi:hypothetical protein
MRGIANEQHKLTISTEKPTSTPVGHAQPERTNPLAIHQKSACAFV